LLRAYAERRSEPAFAVLVRRHVDLVFSAAQRMVCDAHLAEDVAQGVFVALAKNAGQLTTRPVLSGWLHRTAQNIAAQTVRTETRRRVREQESAAMSELLAAEPATHWQEIAPHLDAALGALSEPDRDAVMLRYFERKSAREIAQTLGISDEAAQKRVNRAVERLREGFSQLGVTVGAAGLVGLITANAVQAAPVGLTVTISAAALAGTAVTTSTVIAATTKTIAMTTLQKTLVTATVAVLAGTGIYEARQATQLREQNQTLQQKQASLTEQIQRLQNNFVDATNRLADLIAENSRLKSNSNQAELLSLRGQIGVLQTKAKSQSQPKSQMSMVELAKSPQLRERIKATATASLDKVYAKFFTDLNLTPEQASALKELLADRLIADTSAKGVMLTGKMNPDQIQQLNDQVDAEKKALDDQIKQMLGADGFAAYQAYDKTYTQRAEIVGPVGFTDQLTGSMELTSGQTEQLIQAMADEDKEFSFTVDYSAPSKFAGDMTAMFSSENTSQHQKERERLNQLYLARAQNILTPDQISIFRKFLSSRIALENMGLNMNAKTLGGKAVGN